MAGGRPSSFKDEYTVQAFKLGLLGATDAEVASFFEVDVATLNRWKKKHPEFCASLKRGKDDADSRVAQSLFRRALGYSHPAVKILTVSNGNNQGSSVEEVPYIERYPPDTVACIFWLKNRQRDKWRDKQPDEEQGQDATAIAAAIVAAQKAMDKADGLDGE